MPNIAQLLSHLRFRWKWRRARRQKRTLRLGLGRVREFLAALNEAGIPYLVLRWPDEVPLAPEDEIKMTHDIDLFVDTTRLKEIVQLASTCPGPVKCDIYSPTGQHATSFKRMPYYPPVLGEEVLANRELCRGAFYIPTPEFYFKSLAFHLVYHKGVASGIPSGTEIRSDASPARPYATLIEQLGERLKVPVERPYSLLKLHNYLKSVEWSMPHDLMVRWPQQHEWMRWLARHEEERIEPFANRLPQLMVFLLRADALEPGMQEKAVELLQSRFRVLKTEHLDRDQIRRVMRSVRGGNWMEHGKTELVEPRVALICCDPAPEPVAPRHPFARKHPFVTNVNAFYKHDVRNILNESFPTSPKRTAIHGSDNAFEAQHYLQAIYASRHAEICEELFHTMESLKCHPALPSSTSFRSAACGVTV